MTGVNSSKRSYDRLFEALERLQGTQIKTDIESGGEGKAGFFSWLEAAQLHYSKSPTGEKRLKAVQVRLCDWLFRAILKDRHVLEYVPSYFQLGPVERRLYEVARSSCIDGPISTTLEQLRLQLGYQSSARQFKGVLKNIIESDSIPGFTLSLQKPLATSGIPSRKVDAEIVSIVPHAQANHTSETAPAD